ncbi:hypothetical protein FB466_0730 [Klugiella xanthotipulae]|uniref:Uncharacterized protein n=1 Tax=Klugiella xanthotipulae TaxID=244735 RepID=A0A543I619_9MICO|nr:hypothetical protein FB466_0730 [Klugiella xanthotipulae]
MPRGSGLLSCARTGTDPLPVPLGVPVNRRDIRVFGATSFVKRNKFV